MQEKGKRKFKTLVLPKTQTTHRWTDIQSACVPSGISTVSELFAFKTANRSQLDKYHDSIRPVIQEAVSVFHLEEVPEEVISRHILELMQALSSVKKCRTCDHKPDQVLSCYLPRITFDEAYDDLHFAVIRCPHQDKVRLRQLYDRDIQAMMVSPRFRSRTFENFEPSAQSIRLLDYCKSFVLNYQESARGMYIFGGFGSGKTHLAVATILSLRKERHVSSPFLFAPEYLSRLKSFFSKNEKQEELRNFYRTASVLVIDDFGEGKKDESGQLTEWVKEEFKQLIFYRYEHNLTTIITSRYSPSELSHVVDPAVVSRIIDMCVLLQNEDADYRYKHLTIIR